MSKLHSLDQERQLYCIEEGKRHYSCLGFQVALQRATAVAAWAGLPAPVEPPGTEAAYQEYLNIYAQGAARARNSRTRCPAELTPALIGLEHKRVEVTGPGGYRKRFYVGKSCGWCPVHLEIARITSTGGPAVYWPDGARVRVVS